MTYGASPIRRAATTSVPGAASSGWYRYGVPHTVRGWGSPREENSASAVRLVFGVAATVMAWLLDRAGWRAAFVACSAGVYLGALLSLPAFKGYRQIIHDKSEQSFQKEIVKNKPAFLMILGYGAHMWEMYGMRSWLAPFFTALLVSHGMAQGAATGWAATAAAVIIGIGTFSTAITGTLSDRLGRTRTISIVMSASALLSFTFGWLINANPWLAFAVGVAYGYLIVAESPGTITLRPSSGDDVTILRRNVAELRTSYAKFAEIDHISDVAPPDLDISKEGNQIVISVAYEKRIKLFGPTSLIIEYQASTSGQ